MSDSISGSLSQSFGWSSPSAGGRIVPGRLPLDAMFFFNSLLIQGDEKSVGRVAWTRGGGDSVGGLCLDVDPFPLP